MGKIFYLLGKSASGKDSIYEILKADESLGLKTVVLYTTRPMREGEQEGISYHFVTADRMEEFREQGKLIEIRTYQTIHGPWSYATVDGGDWNLRENNFLVVGTLESYHSMKAYFGEDMVVPFYINVEDGERLSRALKREKKQKEPKYEELCRRFLADQADFAPAKLEAEGIYTFYENDVLENCIAQVRQEILTQMGRN